MLYPSAAQWVSALHEQNALHRYAQTQQQYSPEQKQAVLQAADDYNRSQVRADRRPVQQHQVCRAASGRR